MAWWNGPVLSILASIPTLPLCIIFDAWWIALTVCLTVFGYYIVYESIHKFMHLPDKRKIEGSRIYKFLNGHHLLHHRYMNKNFNVVLPLADWLMGTLILRAPQEFDQPIAPPVPDVQPHKNQKAA